MYTIPCEAVFNQHPDVFRTALVGIGAVPEQKPAICVELNEGVDSGTTETITADLLQLAKANPHTKDIDTIFFHSGFPVDIRHNAKIFREELAEWAADQMA